MEISRLDARSERLDAGRGSGSRRLAERVVRASGTDTEVAGRTGRGRGDRPAAAGAGAGQSRRQRAQARAGAGVADGRRAVVTVRDHGDGYPAYLVEHGPQRFRTEGGCQGARAGADHRAGAGGGAGGAAGVRERAGRRGVSPPLTLRFRTLPGSGRRRPRWRSVTCAAAPSKWRLSVPRFAPFLAVPPMSLRSSPTRRLAIAPPPAPWRARGGWPRPRRRRRAGRERQRST